MKQRSFLNSSDKDKESEQQQRKNTLDWRYEQNDIRSKKHIFWKHGGNCTAILAKRV